MSIDMGRSKVQWSKQSLFMLEHRVNKAISHSKYPYSFPWQKSCLEDFMKLEWRPCLRKIWYFRKVRDSPRDLIPCPSITLPVANLDTPLQPGKPSNIHIRNPLQLALYHFWNRSPYQLGISFNNELWQEHHIFEQLNCKNSSFPHVLIYIQSDYKASFFEIRCPWGSMPLLL